MNIKGEMSTAFHDIPVWVWYAGVGATGILYVIKRRSASATATSGVTTLTPATVAPPNSDSNTGVDTVAQYTVLQGEINTLQNQVQKLGSPTQPPVPPATPPPGASVVPGSNGQSWFDPATGRWNFGFQDQGGSFTPLPSPTGTVWHPLDPTYTPPPVTGGSTLYRPMGSLYGSMTNPMHALYADRVIDLGPPIEASAPENLSFFDRIFRGRRASSSADLPGVPAVPSPPSNDSYAGLHWPAGYTVTPHEIKGN